MQGYYGSTEPATMDNDKNLSKFILKEYEQRMLDQIRNIVRHELETHRKLVFEKIDKAAKPKEAKSTVEPNFTKVKKTKVKKDDELLKLDSSIDDADEACLNI